MLETVATDPHLQPALMRLAHAVGRQQDAERALVAAALRVSSAGDAASVASLRALARCEVLERRARLHVDIARKALARQRAAVLDDQRRVPATFRRLIPRATAAPVEVLGTAAPRERSASPDRAAS